MRVCYVYLREVGEELTGVDNKTISKCAALGELFSKFSIVNVSNSKFTIPGAELINYPLHRSKLWKQELVTKSKFRALERFLNEKGEEYDFLIMRYAWASQYQLRLVKRFPNTIVFEHNTNYVSEAAVIAESNKELLPFKLRPSVMFFYLKNVWLLSYVEKTMGPKILAHAAGGMAVTNEIKRFEEHRCPGYKIKTFSNGINVLDDVKLTKEIGSVYRGLFLAGTYADWHGIERIIDSLVASKHALDFKIDFVGRIGEKIKQRYAHLENVVFLDYMTLEELKERMPSYHFGLGTAAIHKKNLVEGSVLKLREYLSSGLPVVYGHHDPYVMANVELKKYALEFPANDELMDFDETYSWLETLYQEPALNEKIHKVVAKTLSWKSTLKELPAFLESLKKS